MIRNNFRLTQNEKVKIIEYNSLDYNIQDIAKEISCNAKTVRRVVQRWNEENTIENYIPTGRPKTISDLKRQKIIRIVTNKPFSSSKEIAQRFSISESYCRKISNNSGLTGCKPKRKPPLTREHIRSRRHFERLFRHWSVNEWRKVIFSDETLIELDKLKKKGWVWRPKNVLNDNKYCTFHSGRYGIRCKFWGAIGYNYKSDLIQIDQSLNREKYQNISQNQIFPNFNTINNTNFNFFSAR
ncbi:transposable element-related [Anaeramoeba flamelloides]|uniref:Transposable element-related n=1 Tax=Anaeramoeba flamelloides TaxID=1746091 RepID=A0AAV8AGM2_9EUKA|nr:transposable element-related [Anaeramoeba flamelloides]